MPVSIFEYGDGVPSENIVQDQSVEQQPIHSDSARAGSGVARGVSIGIGVVGQICLAIVVALGGDPLIGAVAAIAIAGCSLILVIAEAGRSMGN